MNCARRREIINVWNFISNMFQISEEVFKEYLNCYSNNYNRALAFGHPPIRGLPHCQNEET